MLQVGETDGVLELFSDHGLRCTRQRRALYEALVSDKTHPTADRLYKQVSPRVSGLSLATVYNTLEAFCAAGLAQKLPGSQNGTACYDATVENHLHLRCKSTGQVADVPADLGRKVLEMIPQALLKQLQEQLHFSIDQIKIELVGQFQESPASHAAALPELPAFKHNGHAVLNSAAQP